MRYELLQPRSVQEAVSFLKAHREESRVIAGGQSLLLMLRAGMLKPAFLVSLGGIENLAGTEIAPDGRLHIGALAPHRRVAESSLVREHAGILAQAAAWVGSTPVRNFGTLGGNLCHNEMGSDPPPALLALEAQAVCMGPGGRRLVPMSDLFTDFFATSIEPDEILVGVEVPPLPSGFIGVYLKHATRPGDLAVVGVAALLQVRDGRCQQARLALGGVGPVPYRALEAERILCERTLDDALIDDAAEAAAEKADPISDAHASAGYRKKMARLFVKRAINQVLGGPERSGA